MPHHIHAQNPSGVLQVRREDIIGDLLKFNNSNCFNCLQFLTSIQRLCCMSSTMLQRLALYRSDLCTRLDSCLGTGPTRVFWPYQWAVSFNMISTEEGEIESEMDRSTIREEGGRGCQTRARLVPNTFPFHLSHHTHDNNISCT